MAEPFPVTWPDLKPDLIGRCQVCGKSPVVPITGMCIPCTFDNVEPSPATGKENNVDHTFTLDWPHGHVTRDGRPARIICNDAKSTSPIIALVQEQGNERIFWYLRDGRWSTLSIDDADLFNAPEPKIRVWLVRTYSTLNGAWTSDEKTADLWRNSGDTLVGPFELDLPTKET